MPESTYLSARFVREATAEGEEHLSHRGAQLELADAVADGVLEDDVRRRCCDAIRDADQPTTRAEVANAVGISVRLAAFHLDKLVDAGLLHPTTAARRDADGARRPAKRYRTSDAAIELSLPLRRYDVLATITRSEHRHEREPREVARLAGAQLIGQAGPRNAVRRVQIALAELGFEPVRRTG